MKKKVRIYENITPAGIFTKHRYYYFFVLENKLFGKVCNRCVGFISYGLLQKDEKDEFEVELEKNYNLDMEIEKLLPKGSCFLKEIELEIGCYYPRIKWISPLLIYPLEEKTNAIPFFDAAKMLLKKLNDITYTIDINPSNNLCYGHEIRSLLLLICMEIENNFVSTLKINGFIKDNYRTSDFFILKDYWNLDEYELKFEYFTTYPSLRPYENWDINKPTQSLNWYHDYNKTKHSREEYFTKGNLINTLYAMAALIILIDAQYGINTEGAKDIFIFDGIKIKKPMHKPEQIYIKLPNSTTLNKSKLYN